MQIVGLMCVRDEADLLPEVYPHVKSLVDDIFAYDDGSIDGTWDIVKNSSYAIRREDDKNRQPINRPNYHHLLEKIKREYDYRRQDVWAVIAMGDRFFLNKTPQQIVAEAGNYTSVQGIQLDFLRHRLDPWTEENDTFPVWHVSLRESCRWFRYDERCVVAFKVTDDASYLRSPYPWPKNIGQYKFHEYDKQVTIDMPFLEHQGRRSPKAQMWRMGSGSRFISIRKPTPDYSTFDAVMQNWPHFYNDYRVFPWVDMSSLDFMVKWHNLMTEPETDLNLKRKWFFRGLEIAQQQNPLPKRIV